MADKIIPAKQRFLKYVYPDLNSGCWLWGGALNNRGYGNFWDGNRITTTHRFSYELHKGPIPIGEGPHGICVCHRCDVRLCVNPEHLFLGSNADNSHDRDRKGRLGERRGMANANAKLTDADIRAIRKSTLPTSIMAALYNVSNSTICCIKSKRTWAFVEDEKGS